MTAAFRKIQVSDAARTSSACRSAEDSFQPTRTPEERKIVEEAAAAIRRVAAMPDRLVVVAAGGEIWAARSDAFKPRPTATSWHFDAFARLLEEEAGPRWINRSDVGELALFVVAREKMRAVARGERP